MYSSGASAGAVAAAISPDDHSPFAIVPASKPQYLAPDSGTSKLKTATASSYDVVSEAKILSITIPTDLSVFRFLRWKPSRPPKSAFAIFR